MTELIKENQDQIALVTLNRTDKHNAFDDALLQQLQEALDEAIAQDEIRVILLKANGRHFSAGADLAWMQRMANYTEAENLADAKVLAQVMYTLNQSPKPTIAMVQGSAYGGGVGLAAACDIAIAAETARFCFSEVKLGLIPAVISPYVIQAIGARNAKALFMSAEIFNAKRALELQLIQYCIPENELLSFTLNHAKQIAQWPAHAIQDVKLLVQAVQNQPIDIELQNMTAARIAKKRVSVEGQAGIKAFLNKSN